MVELETEILQKDSRCNIPVDFVAHTNKSSQESRERLRPQTLHVYKLLRWSTDCYSGQSQR